MQQYFERYPSVKEYMTRTRAFAVEHGYVETLAGRRLYLPNIHAKNGMLRQAAERAAINAPMQGTAADIIKLAMINMHEWIEAVSDKMMMILQVHDELVFEVDADFAPEAMKIIREKMMQAFSLKVPLDVSVHQGLNWDEAH
jgi:DNA polymerase-1